MEVVDAAIVGGGPAGSTCAAFCAAAGLRTLVLEREKFPREKVCGDCINPAGWPVLQRLELEEEIRNCPHASLDAVEFIAIGGQKLRIDLPRGDNGMISVKRSSFDHLLLNRARTLGAEIREETTLIALDRTAAKNWRIDIVRETFAARVVVGADGRNSTVARLRNLLPRPERERVALQAHIPLPRDFGDRIVLQFLPEGYSGQAPVNDSELNLCLVGTPPTISSLRNWAEREFKLAAEQAWRTITPLTRACSSRPREFVLHRRCGACRRAVYRRRNLLRVAIRRVGRQCDRKNHSRRRSPTCNTRIHSCSSRDVSRAIVDQSNRARGRLIAAVRVAAPTS